MRNTTLDTAKGISILSVIIIHTLSALNIFPINEPVFGILDRVIQHITHAAVPIFIGLSGYVLSLKYQPTQSYSSFMKKRLIALLPLYLLWTLSFQLFFRSHLPWSNYYADKPWWFVLFLGGGDYHLYFVPVLIILYGVFPLLYRMLEKNPVLLLTIAAVIQTCVYWYITANPSTPYLYVDQFIYRVPVAWIWYFVLGIYAAKHSVRVIPAFFAVFAGLLLSIIQGEYLHQQGFSSVIATMATRIPIMLYASGLLVVIFHFRSQKPNLLAKLGENSYLIFLCHTMPLWITQVLIKTQEIPIMAVLIFFATLLISLNVQNKKAPLLK